MFARVCAPPGRTSAWTYNRSMAVENRAGTRVISPNKAKPFVWPETFVFTVVKFACSSLTAVPLWKSAVADPFGSSEDVAGKNGSAAQPPRRAGMPATKTHFDTPLPPSQPRVGHRWLLLSILAFITHSVLPPSL